MPLRGGGVGPLMANAILNFHFDYLTPSLRNLLDYVLQVRTDYVLQVRNLLTLYYKLELTMYYYCLWYDKLWGPSQRVVTLFTLTVFLEGSRDWLSNVVV